MLAQSHSNKAGTPGDTTPFCHPSPSAQVLGASGHSTCRRGNHGIAIQPLHPLCPCWHHSTDQSRQRQPLSSQTLLLQANGYNWEFLFDLDEQLQFPPEAAVTSLRPDVVIISRSTETVIMLELTVLLEDRKSFKYSALVNACEESGFKAHLFPIEVGCLGYSLHS